MENWKTTYLCANTKDLLYTTKGVLLVHTTYRFVRANFVTYINALNFYSFIIAPYDTYNMALLMTLLIPMEKDYCVNKFSTLYCSAGKAAAQKKQNTLKAAPLMVVAHVHTTSFFSANKQRYF